MDDDDGAFPLLLARLSDTVERPLRWLLPPAEFEDGCAEVWFRIWTRRRQYREERGTVRAWTAGIAWNYTRDWRRRQARARFVNLDKVGPALADESPDPAVTTEQADAAAELCRRVAEALATFPPDVVAIFRLRLQGLDYATIAARVNRPAGTVASAVFRLRAKLLTLIKAPFHPIQQRGDNMSQKTDDIASVLHELSEVKDRLAAVDANVTGELGLIEARLGAVEQKAAPADTPSARAERLLIRLRLFIADPAQHQSVADWAEIEDLVGRRSPAGQEAASPGSVHEGLLPAERVAGTAEGDARARGRTGPTARSRSAAGRRGRCLHGLSVMIPDSSTGEGGTSNDSNPDQAAG
jgi:RNA polymerase sigma factor (sigma-70 family)